MAERTTVEAWIAMNEAGDHAVSVESAEEAAQILRDDLGGEIIRVTPIEVTMDVPELPGPVEVEQREIVEEVEKAAATHGWTEFEAEKEERELEHA